MVFRDIVEGNIPRVAAGERGWTLRVTNVTNQELSVEIQLHAPTYVQTLTLPTKKPH